MVSKDELRRKYKLKILLRGPAGSGKTYSVVKVAEEVARRGCHNLHYAPVDCYFPYIGLLEEGNN